MSITSIVVQSDNGTTDKKERDYVGWSGVLLLLYASKQLPHNHMRMRTSSNARKPDLKINITSTVSNVIVLS